MKNLKHILTLGFVLISILVWSQPRSFSTKPSQFIAEYINYVGSENGTQSKQILQQFQTKWDSAQFVELEQRNIINVANQMLMNDLRIPSFVLFTETMLYAKDSIEEPKYISWSKALIPAIRNGNQTFLTLLTASRNLFKDNTIYASALCSLK